MWVLVRGHDKINNMGVARHRSFPGGKHSKCFEAVEFAGVLRPWNSLVSSMVRFPGCQMAVDGLGMWWLKERYLVSSPHIFNVVFKECGNVRMHLSKELYVSQ